MVAQAWAPGCREEGGLNVSIQVRVLSFSNSSSNLFSEKQNEPCTETQM